MKKNALQFLVCLLLLFAAVHAMSARAMPRPDTIALYFRAGSAVCDPTYRGNADALSKLSKTFLSDLALQINRLVVVGGASPEGFYQDNMHLSRLRAKNMVNMLNRRYSWIFVGGRLPVELRAMVSKPLNSLSEASYSIDELRYVAIFVHYGAQQTSKPTPLEPFVEKPQAPSEPFAGKPQTPSYSSVPVMAAGGSDRRETPLFLDSLAAPTERKIECTRKPLFALKTNLLFDVTSMLNLEIEVPLGRQWSIAVEGVFPWWLWDSRQICLQMLSGHLEFRHWFDRRADRPLLTGWFLGLYGGYGYYDFEYNQKGLQGEFRSVGLSGGYAHQIGRNLSLEYSIGLGYAQNNYRTYNAERDELGDWHLYRQDTRKYDWIGPTRFKLSLVWLLNYKKSSGTK